MQHRPLGGGATGKIVKFADDIVRADCVAVEIKEKKMMQADGAAQDGGRWRPPADCSHWPRRLRRHKPAGMRIAWQRHRPDQRTKRPRLLPAR